MTNLKENRLKLTKRVVESASADPSKRKLIWDDEITGFCVRVYPSGRKSYFFQYRNLSKETKFIKIGVHGNTTAEQAREKAKELALKVCIGEDPSEQKKIINRLETVYQLAQDYLERHGTKKRRKSLLEDKRILEKYIFPFLGDKKIQYVNRRDVESLHNKYQNRPYQANRIISLLSKMFSLAVSWGWCSENPVQGIERFQEQKRDRWLNKEEMARFWDILCSYSYHPTSFAFKLLLLTGARKGEVLNATWDQFDLKKGIWTKPAHLTKQKKAEYLPLSSYTIETLEEFKQLHSCNSIYLFPGRTEGMPLQEVKTFWRTVLKEAQISNFRIHDLRHTFASHLVSRGLSLNIVGKLLGHTQATTTQRYAHLADEPLREAANIFAQNFNEKKNDPL